jgi:hypothetical protein
VKAIWATVGVGLCFFYLGCGSVEIAQAGIPNISQVVPVSLAVGSSGVTVKVLGSNFTDQTVVLWNGGQLATTLIDSNTLASPVETASLSLPGTAQLQVKNSLTGQKSQAVPLTISSAATSATPLSIVTTSLPEAVSGTPYSATLAAGGGTPAYKWSVSSGKLPGGMSLSSSTGIISGTPTAVGSFTFSIAVTDSSSPQQKKSSSFTIVTAAKPLKITTSTLPSGTAKTAYSQTLIATGGTPSYSWSITSGTLPSGMQLIGAKGVISGTPTTSGNFLFTLTVVDKGTPQQKTSAVMAITIASSPAQTIVPLAITSSTLPSAVSGASYSSALLATGGTPAYSWSITSGSLPQGLTLAASTGVISGTPTASGTASFTVTVSDKSNPIQTKSVGLAIVVAPTPLKIAAFTVPPLKLGTYVSQALHAAGGTPSYVWSITSGSLPSGLTLAPATGMISGAPSSSGTSTFTATVSDSSNPLQTVSAPMTVTVTPGLIIASSTLPSGSGTAAYSATLQASGGTPAYTWSIASGTLPAGLSLTSSTGLISGTPTGTGTSTFTAVVSDNSTPVQTASAVMTIAVAGRSLTIAASTPPTGNIGSPYSTSFTASGGTPAYTWAITSGLLPAGLTMATSTGVISGTPTASGTSNFAVTVSDNSNPVQTGSSARSITVAGSPLTVSASSLPSGIAGSAYLATLQASGGTPAYTWSITSGTLPTGLTLAATTGVISGTPTVNGTSNFTATVSDNGSPVQTQSLASSIAVVAATQQTPGVGTTWYIRPDGGTRYSGNVSNGQCDGQADGPYPGTGTNQHCAFNDVRYMWMDGTYGNSAWVMAGGDTLVIRGCAAGPYQQNADAPHCRIGWDKATGNDSQNFWCAGVNASWGCSMPQPPSGTASQHTRILGGCAYGTYTCNPVVGYPYTSNNLTQLYGGFAAGAVMYLYGSQYVDLEGLEITTHNGQCTLVGAVAYPAYCPNSPPYGDEAQWGILTNNTTSNITLQDVYIHGFTNIGMGGPIGGPFTLTRVIIGFNAFAGWNFDDGHDTPDAAGSSITANYLTIIGNGCLEEYPIVHTQFPAKSCWDSNSGGFGDGLSGQDTELDSFVCHHCGLFYNTKDAFIGPHTQITNLDVENSTDAGNMGSEWKFAQYLNGTATFKNNLIIENCNRMSEALPGAAQNFNQNTGLAGSYLTNFCRAGAESFNYLTRLGSSVNFTGNTMVGVDAIMIAAGCGYYTPGNAFNFEYDCLPNPNVFTNNNFLGYTDPSPIFSGSAPALFYVDPAYPYITITSSYNNEYNIKPGTGDHCGTNHILCVDPLLVKEPALPWPGTETDFDVFNAFVTGNSFYPAIGSPLIGAGTTISGLTTDYYATNRPTPPTIGAVEP